MSDTSGGSQPSSPALAGGFAGAGGAALGGSVLATATSPSVMGSGGGVGAGAAGAATDLLGAGGDADCTVSVMGTPLDPLVSGMLASVEVDSTLYVPSQLKLIFRGKPDEVLEPGGLQLATDITVSAKVDGVPTPLLTGEVTSVEVDFADGETLTIVRGMDRSHRLMRGTQTMAYPEALASEVVEELITEAGLLPGEIVPTTNTYEWLSQANVSAWVFIQQLAALENYVAYADGEGLFNFCPMPAPEAGLPPVMSWDLPATGTQLVMGSNLHRLRAVVSGSEQIPEVTVTGYDPTATMPVVGPSPTAPSTSQSLDPATLPPVVAEEFEAQPFFDASRPFDSEGQAISWARSIASDVSGALAEVEGECTGNPAILAGESITIGMAGLPFDGYYVCTAARHVFDWGGAGYTTWVTAGGYRDRSLYALTSGSSPNDGVRPHIGGLVIGKVTDNLDDEGMGRVKVMFPWLAEDYVSAWARVMQIGASEAGGGFLWVPEVGDEVLIGFDRGSIDHPYVIGNLYNGLAKPIPAPSIDGMVANRRISSRLAHTIQWNDGPTANGISIMTAPAEDPPTSVVLDADEMKITINSNGEIQISGATNVQISSMAALSIDGQSITIGSEATESLTIAGATITVGGPTTEEMSMGGPETMVSVSGSLISLGGE